MAYSPLTDVVADMMMITRALVPLDPRLEVIVITMERTGAEVMIPRAEHHQHQTRLTLELEIVTRAGESRGEAGWSALILDTGHGEMTTVLITWDTHLTTQS